MPVEEEQEGRARITVSVPPTLPPRIQALRDRGVLLNVSGEVTKALEKILEEAKNPQLARRAAIVDRLQKAIKHRRGPDHQAGFDEGERWAADVASWREIRSLASYGDDDVEVESTFDRSDGPFTLSFKGAFAAPSQDYFAYDWGNQHSPIVFGAPAWSQTPHIANDAQWVTDPYRCETYWRGWLAGVRSVFELVASDIHALESELASHELKESDWVHHPIFGIGQVVKATPTEHDVEVVVRFDRVGLKILSKRLAPLESLLPEFVEARRDAQAATARDRAERSTDAIRDVDPDEIPF